MILIDDRQGSKELYPLIKRLNVPTEIARLEYGDFAMEGNGPKGIASIGIERKTLHDMLDSINSSRYTAHQLPGMARMYDFSFLLLEGCWKSDENGLLWEGYRGGSSWGMLRGQGRSVLYSKLRRYLFSISLSGVIVIYTRDMEHTARDVVELYHYYSKKWNDHTALFEKQIITLPNISMTPLTLCRRWAAEIKDIGVKLSAEAEKIFHRKPIELAQSDESDWLQIRGVGPATATKIIKEIRGR